MTYNPNSNNLVVYKARGQKRAKKGKLQVLFNNRTGCKVSCCKKGWKGKNCGKKKKAKLNFN